MLRNLLLRNFLLKILLITYFPIVIPTYFLCILHFNSYIVNIFGYLSFLVNIIFMSLIWSIYILIKAIRETNAISININHSLEDNRPFFFVLRSFHKTELQEFSPIGPPRLTKSTTSFIRYIENSLFNLGGVVLLGGDLTYYDDMDSSLPRSIILGSNDKTWKMDFELLSTLCWAIIVVPQTSGGILEELQMINNLGIQYKTIIAMPPKAVFGASEMVWEQIRADIKHRGFKLPNYESKGMVYIPDMDFSIKKAETFLSYKNNAIENAFALLINSLPKSETSLKTALLNLALASWRWSN